MMLNRRTGNVSHHYFRELPTLLREGDLLVVNDTRVIPARLVGQKATGGKVELLLVRNLDNTGKVWRCMAKRIARMHTGTRFQFHQVVEGIVREVEERSTLKVEFSPPLTEGVIQEVGEVPLPPYIFRPEGPLEEDSRRYQTIFARRAGAVAAPTAGLHFSLELLSALRDQGIETVSITLHVGPGTFLPIRVEKISEHTMHEEYFEISRESAQHINEAKRQGRRIIAVGTTVVRTLESAARGNEVEEGGHWTSLFIYPPYLFRIVDGMITNFHLPRSTLLLLVCSFAGKEHIFRAYETAKRKRYRFYSYGDAMLIV